MYVSTMALRASDLASAWWWSQPHPLEAPEPEPQYPVGATPLSLFYPKGPLSAAHCSPLIMTYPLTSTSYFHFDLVGVIFRVRGRAWERCEHMKTQDTVGSAVSW